MNTTNQHLTGKTKVRAALQRGEKVSSLEAFKLFGLYHLAGTIRNLRADGMAINTVMVETTNKDGEAVRYARYEAA